jgi:peptide/nickel transport system substrate-binding protein
VRQAVSLALDRKALAASSTARGIPASQLVPPFVFGFTPKLPELLPDPERSRALLAEAGFASGFDVTLHARKAFAETATHVAERLQPVGIRVKVEALADAEYFELVKGRGASFFLSRWGCPTGDASDLFDSGLHSRDEARHYGSGNSGGLSDPELDRLIEESAQIADLPVRRLALEKLMQRAMDEVYWVPLVLDEDVYALRRGLSFTPRADSYLMLAEIRPSPRS